MFSIFHVTEQSPVSILGWKKATVRNKIVLLKIIVALYVLSWRSGNESMPELVTHWFRWLWQPPVHMLKPITFQWLSVHVCSSPECAASAFGYLRTLLILAPNSSTFWISDTPGTCKQKEHCREQITCTTEVRVRLTGKALNASCLLGIAGGLADGPKISREWSRKSRVGYVLQEFYVKLIELKLRIHVGESHVVRLWVGRIWRVSCVWQRSLNFYTNSKQVNQQTTKPIHD